MQDVKHKGKNYRNNFGNSYPTYLKKHQLRWFKAYFFMFVYRAVRLYVHITSIKLHCLMLFICCSTKAQSKSKERGDFMKGSSPSKSSSGSFSKSSTLLCVAVGTSEPIFSVNSQVLHRNTCMSSPAQVRLCLSIFKAWNTSDMDWRHTSGLHTCGSVGN